MNKQNASRKKSYYLIHSGSSKRSAVVSEVFNARGLEFALGFVCLLCCVAVCFFQISGHSI